METKIIGLILLVCAALIFQYSYDDFMGAFFSPSIKLKSKIEKDITSSLEQEASENKSNIHHVQFVYRSKDAHDFLKKHPPQFQTNKNGKLWLEVEVLDLSDSEAPGFITQTSVFDLKTKNKTAEFGQTYHIKDFDKDAEFTIEAEAPTEQVQKPEEPLAPKKEVLQKPAAAKKTNEEK